MNGIEFGVGNNDILLFHYDAIQLFIFQTMPHTHTLTELSG